MIIKKQILILFLGLYTGSFAVLGDGAEGYVEVAKDGLYKPQVNLLSGLVEAVAPSVVNIYASKVVKQRVVSPFLGAFGGMEQFLFGMPVERIQKSLGSGVIIRPNGLIVTNTHVIEGAQEIKVVLNDNREFKAKIVMSDKKADLALLKIEGGSEVFHAAEIRDADELKIGDDVFAIGNPYGIGQSVSKGIVSATARNIGGSKDYRSYIQTDAAVNSGNSGGGLFSIEQSATGEFRARLVGVTTAIISKDGGFQGMSLAINSNMLKPLLASYDKGAKTIQKAWLGMGVQSVDSTMASSLGLLKPMGVLVTGVYPKSPADLAGLKVGDLITHINEKPIKNDENFHFRLSTFVDSETLTLSYVRAKAKTDVKIKLGVPPETPPRNATSLDGKNALGGATIVNLSPALANEFSIDPMRQGVMILEIKRNSYAHVLGFLPGDIILRVNDVEMTLVQDLVDLFKKPLSGMVVEFKRDSKTLVLTILTNGQVSLREK